MPAVRWGPYHRNPELPNDICDLCGNRVERDRLVLADVDGLRGYYVCDLHPDEVIFRSTPSHRDYQRYGRSAILGVVGERPEDHKMTRTPVWWETEE